MQGFKTVGELLDKESLVNGQYYVVRIYFDRTKAWTELARTEQGQAIMDIKSALASNGFNILNYGRVGGYQLWLFGQYTRNPIPFLAIAVIGLIGAIVGAYYLTITNGTVERMVEITGSGETIARAGAFGIGSLALLVLVLIGVWGFRKR